MSLGWRPEVDLRFAFPRIRVGLNLFICSAYFSALGPFRIETNWFQIDFIGEWWKEINRKERIIFLKNGPSSAFFVYYCLFKQTLQFLQQIYVKNSYSHSSSIRHWDSNPRPSVIKSPPITTRPGLPPGEYLFEMIFELCCILLQQSRATILLSTFDVFNIDKYTCIGCRHSSVDSSATIILLPQVRVHVRFIIYRQIFAIFFLCKEWQ